METFYITFGRSGIRNGWVRVEARDEMIVRSWAHREYGYCWSMLYTQEEWDRLSAGRDLSRYYPAGEFGMETLLYTEPLGAR